MLIGGVTSNLWIGTLRRFALSFSDGEGTVAAPVVDEQELVCRGQIRNDAFQPAVEFREVTGDLTRERHHVCIFGGRFAEPAM